MGIEFSDRYPCQTRGSRIIPGEVGGSSLPVPDLTKVVRRPIAISSVSRNRFPNWAWDGTAHHRECVPGMRSIQQDDRYSGRCFVQLFRGSIGHYVMGAMK